jgi:hypothetical protein
MSAGEFRVSVASAGMVNKSSTTSRRAAAISLASDPPAHTGHVFAGPRPISAILTGNWISATEIAIIEAEADIEDYRRLAGSLYE